MYRYISENICVSIIRINYLVSPKLFRTPISTECVRNQVYNYLSERGLAASGSLGLCCSKHVTSIYTKVFYKDLESSNLISLSKLLKTP
jgi:hypothetical protein